MKILDCFGFLTQYVYAKNTSEGVGVLTSPLNAKDLPTLVADILTLVYQVGLPIVVVMIVYAGFMYVRARGNPAEITKAHDAIKWTLIGTAIVLGASVISIIIQGTINSLAQ